MKIADRIYLDALQRGLMNVSQQIYRRNIQLTSNKQLVRPSDDPPTAALILRFHADVRCFADRLEAVRAGVDHAQSVDRVLGAVAGCLQRARNLALQCRASGMPDAGRQALANEIEGIIEHLADEANSTLAGRYLLGGTRDDRPPIQLDEVSGRYVYVGNDELPKVPVAPQRMAPAGIAGCVVFNFPDGSGGRPVPDVEADVFTVLQQAVAALRQGDDEGLVEAINSLEALHENVVEQRGILGGYVLRLRAAGQAAEDGQQHVKMILGNIEEVDVAQAVVEMKRLEVTYQAALFAIGKITSLTTVFDVMAQ